MLSFIIIVLLLFLIPGPAVMITISQTIKGGRKNGVRTALGIGLGDLVHTMAAVLGLSAILMSSAIAFEIVKYIGVAYLVFLGIQMFITKKEQEKDLRGNSSGVEDVNNKLSNKSFRQGFLVELLNPKTSLFFLAFLPQFVQSEGYPISVQLLILGLTFVLMSAIYTIILALITSFIGEKLSNRSNMPSKWIERAIGLVYIGLGIRLATQTQ